VAAGHYYLGTVGKRFFGRLVQVGALTLGAGWADDQAFDQGIGFTDIVKRPTQSEDLVQPEEYHHGRPLLLEKLERAAPGLVIFTFKKVATRMLGNFRGNGILPDTTLGGADVFVMPGPYAKREEADASLAELASLLRRVGG
jgi:TDG/mug DNA glycosylase family protein